MEFLNEQDNAPLATMEDMLAAANELEDDAAASDEEANLSEDAASDNDFASASEDEAPDDDKDAAASASEDHAPDDDEDDAASVSEDEGSQHKQIKLIDEPSSFFEPEWHFKIKTPKETVSSTQIIANLPYECFRLIPMQYSKFNEDECSYKWKNLLSSYGHEPKDVNQLKKFLRYIGIDVSIDYSYKTTSSNLDFQFDMFNKEIMIDHSLKVPAVKPEYYKYTINTLNRYFGIVTLTKMEVFQVRYDDNDKVVEIIQRYSKNSFLDAFEPLRIFLCFWLKNSCRRQYRRYVFEPELPIDTRHDFNLYLGMKI